MILPRLLLLTHESEIMDERFRATVDGKWGFLSVLLSGQLTMSKWKVEFLKKKEFLSDQLVKVAALLGSSEKVATACFVSFLRCLMSPPAVRTALPAYFDVLEVSLFQYKAAVKFMLGDGYQNIADELQYWAIMDNFVDKERWLFSQGRACFNSCDTDGFENLLMVIGNQLARVGNGTSQLDPKAPGRKSLVAREEQQRRSAEVARLRAQSYAKWHGLFAGMKKKELAAEAAKRDVYGCHSMKKAKLRVALILRLVYRDLIAHRHDEIRTRSKHALLFHLAAGRFIRWQLRQIRLRELTIKERAARDNVAAAGPPRPTSQGCRGNETTG